MRVHLKVWSILHGQEKMRLMMLIGELSKRSGICRDTLRYYEKLGLIAGSKSKSSYRQYSEALLDRLELLKKAKVLGFTLLQIRDLLDQWEGNKLTKQQKMIIFEEKIVEIDCKIDELRQVKRYLKHKLKIVYQSL